MRKLYEAHIRLSFVWRITIPSDVRDLSYRKGVNDFKVVKVVEGVKVVRGVKLHGLRSVEDLYYIS